MIITELINEVQCGNLNHVLTRLYGDTALLPQKERYIRVLEEAKDLYGDLDAHIFSAPGRTEVGGNHTDHQLGKVVAASIDLDVIAVVIPQKEKIIEYHAKGFTVQPVNIQDLDIHDHEKNTTEALIRGISAGFMQRGYTIGGFKAYAHSNVLAGGGMSSSAAFEVLVGTVFNHLYNHGAISCEEIAKIGQYSENTYFMKSCGLLDQMACSTGNFAAMDFADPKNPKVESISFDPSIYGYDLILTDVRASHADLSDEYSAVPFEMKQVARYFGKDVLSQITVNDLLSAVGEIRKTVGDRAFLRAYHFLHETKRAADQAEALKQKNISSFLKLVKESGQSSYMYLQNVFVPNDSKNQALAIALSLSREILADDGAYRVHGGGFAGTIQAYVPFAKTDEYIAVMERVFGKDCCYKLRIRDCGGICII